MQNEMKQKIDSLIQNNAVVLFMKGNKEQPQCGFSKRVVDVLKQTCSEFTTVDILADPAMREAIKVYSSWPTIPQLYINGDFIGGCDIVLDMFAKRELQSILNTKRAERLPSMEITDAASSALANASADCQGNECIRLSITASFEHGLTFDTPHDDDFCFEKNGVKLIIDPYSAARAQGLHVDYIHDQLDAGFQFTNPLEPKPVSELSVEELSSWRAQNKDALVIDVRTKQEWETARLSFAKLLEEMTKEELNALDKNLPIVLHCHHGGRSRRAAESFRARGFTNVYTLTGGIDAWSKKIDAGVPVY